MEPGTWNPAPVPTSLAVTDRMLQNLAGTRPWVILVGIVALLVGALFCLGSIPMLMAGSLMANAPLPAEAEPVARSFLGVFKMVGPIYLVFAALSVTAGVQLIRYGTAISRVLAGEGAPALEEALGLQKSHWVLAGVTCILWIVFTVVMIVWVFVTAFSAFGHMR